LHLISDINECEDKLHNCDPLIQLCINTYGSFQCQNRKKSPPETSCPMGFQLDKDSRTCVGE